MTKDRQQPKTITVKDILAESSKSDFIDYVNQNIGKAVRCLVIFGTPNECGGMEFTGQQVGFDYMYELDGFMKAAAEIFASCDLDDSDEESEL